MSPTQIWPICLWMTTTVPAAPRTRTPWPPCLSLGLPRGPWCTPSPISHTQHIPSPASRLRTTSLPVTATPRAALAANTAKVSGEKCSFIQYLFLEWDAVGEAAVSKLFLFEGPLQNITQEVKSWQSYIVCSDIVYNISCGSWWLHTGLLIMDIILENTVKQDIWAYCSISTISGFFLAQMGHLKMTAHPWSMSTNGNKSALYYFLPI